MIQTKRNTAAILIFLLSLTQKGIADEETSIQFTYIYIHSVIKFNCSVNEPKNGVYFYNPDGFGVAHCHILFEISCLSKVTYGQIEYDNSTNTTVFSVNVDKTYVNGNWTCAHGLGIDDQRCNVTVDISEAKTSELKEDGIKIGYAALGSFVFSLLTTACILRILRDCKKQMPRFSRPAVGLTIIVIIVVGFTIGLVLVYNYIKYIDKLYEYYVPAVIVGFSFGICTTVIWESFSLSSDNANQSDTERS